MCVGGLHVILWASRRAGVHSRNRGRSLDSYCRRQIRPGSRIEPPVLEFQNKDRVWIRQLEKRCTVRGARLELIAAPTCDAQNLVGEGSVIGVVAMCLRAGLVLLPVRPLTTLMRDRPD